MSENDSDTDKRGEFLVKLLSDLNDAISALVDLSVAWSDKDFPRAHDKYAEALSRLDHALTATQKAGKRMPASKRYRRQIDGVRQELSPLQNFLSERVP